MTCNVGGIERAIRIVAGLLLIAVGALAELPPVGMGIALTVGVVLLVTGAVRYCPLTAMLGINTCQPSSDVKK
ncbi:MAG: DUF2892 domain-containing protein [Nitrospira sp.]|nr:DUF2892 domain-containing protein [Nitrospira sp.]